MIGLEDSSNHDTLDAHTPVFLYLAEQELSLKGVIRCVFSPASNKLVSACLIFDGGALVAQLGSKPTSEVTSPQETLDEAAQAAANEADAILDSLQMPQMNVLVPSNMVSVVPSSSASEGSLDKGDSCDESFGDHQSDKQDSQDSTTSGMTTRRVQRRDH
jgi:CheY-like chemotaxis protein